MKVNWMVLGFLILAMPADGQGRQDEKPLPEEARRRLDYGLGSWQSRTESLGKDGEVVRTTYSQTERRFVIDDRVLEISGVMKETGTTFRAWEYYDVRNEKYSLTSIDREGRLMTMSGELGAEFSWTSEPREMRDGGSFLMRFTHYDIEPASFTALGEISRDGGKTWRAFTRQFLTRRSE